MRLFGAPCWPPAVIAPMGPKDAAVQRLAGCGFDSLPEDVHFGSTEKETLNCPRVCE